MIDRLEPRLQYATISGVLWNDADSSQTFDKGEKPIAGATVFIDSNANGSFDAGEPTAVTDSTGRYVFTQMAKGTYLIGTTEDPAALLQTNVGPDGTAEGRFNIDITGLDNASPRVKAAFAMAARHWESIITGDVPDVTLRNGEVVDDLTIAASVNPIDGAEGILGQSDPTAFRAKSFIPYEGFMQFDSADLAELQSSGQLNDVILHEMGHVLGFGTIWGDLGLIAGSHSRSPRFIGQTAVQEYDKIFGITDLSVPIENSGSDGTRDSHWKEDVLKEELMTGYEPDPSDDQPVPLSAITVGQFADEGYQVNLKAADRWNPYTHTVTKTTAVDLGGVADERQIRVFAHDKVTDQDFGFHTVTQPDIRAFTVATAPAAVNRVVTLSAGSIFDGNGDDISGVTFYRESNGVPGLQKGSDTYIAFKDKAKAKVYSVTTNTGGTAGDATYYAYATDTGGYTGHKQRTITVENVDTPADAPQNVAVRERASNEVHFAFTDDSTNVDGYRVELSNSPDFTGDTILQVLNIAASPMATNIDMLRPGRRYYVRVRGFNAAGSSPFSDTVSFETV